MFMLTRELWVPRLRLDRLDEAFLDALTAEEHARILAMFPFPAFVPTGIPPLVSTFTNYSAGTVTATKPNGAKTLMAEAIGGGAVATTRNTIYGGSGGHYARKNAYNVASIASVSVTPGYPGSASTVTDPSGNTIVSASPGVGQAGNPVSSSTGDLVYVGGAGVQSSNGGGGGSGGPNGPGASGNGSTGGAGGGGLPGSSGNGGNGGSVGSVFGGGAGQGADSGGNPLQGAQGWVRLTWSFS